jgi:hypothetical protein
MNHSHHHSLHDTAIRSVLGFGHEVRVQLRDSHVIVGSIVPVVESTHEESTHEDFRIRPWGVSSDMTVKFADVARAAPVRQMFWRRQRGISSAQVAGVFRRSVIRRAR